MALAEMAAREMAARDRAPEAVRSRTPTCLAEIAAAQQLSVAYLEQLFAKLRRAGLVASARGPGGGYRLALPPAAIAIADIVDAVEEPITTTRCEGGNPGCLAAGLRCRTHDLWHELGAQIRLFLAGVTRGGGGGGGGAAPAAAPLPPRAEGPAGTAAAVVAAANGD
jgi:Rrf2 family iron-sulfur cluster assembly transcriptional regulator